MSRKVWVIERDGEPIASGVNEAEGLAMVPSPGCTLVWYAPDTRDGLTMVEAMLRRTGDAAQAKAYAVSTRHAQRGIFAGRSDGFTAAADLVAAMLINDEYPAKAPAR